MAYQSAPSHIIRKYCCKIHKNPTVIPLDNHELISYFSDIQDFKVENISPSTLKKTIDINKYPLIDIPASEYKEEYIKKTSYCPCCNKPRDHIDIYKYNQLPYSDGSACSTCNYVSVYNPNDHFHCCEIK